jgi:acyl-CoA synthetase (AMP-forming)/AMP-acid ligase II/acyl carrier protein
MSDRSELIGAFDRIVAQASAQQPLIAGKQTLTYGDFIERVRRLTTWFGALGLNAGDRVVVASNDESATFTVFMAALRNGLATAILDPACPPEEAKTLIDAADPALVCIDRAIYEAAGLGAALPRSIAVIQIDPESEAQADGLKSRLASLFGGGKAGDRGNAYPAALAQWSAAANYLGDADGDAVALILFTSGTTSRPKGVELTHANLAAQFKVFLGQYGIAPTSRILNSLPLNHTDGILKGPALALMAGCTTYRHNRFNAQELTALLASIRKDGITHFVVVPTILALILRFAKEADNAFATRDFRFVICSAGYLDEKLWRDFEARFGVTVVNAYGLTEAVCEAIFCGPDEGSRRLGTIGKPNGAEVRLVRSDGETAAQGEIGEIALRGPLIMKGYFRQPEATAEVVKNGWFHTGDLATVDADGFYTIVGRKKSVIIRGGLNVYPEDVTKILRAIPGVTDAVTFGMPDPIWGETVVSCIVPDPQRRLSETDLIAACRAALSPEKIPTGVHFFDEFPRGPSGKIVLNDIKSLVEARQAEAAPAATGDVESRLIVLAASCFRADPATLSLSSASDNTEGWDSLAHVNLVDAIEETFRIRLSPRDIMRLGSLGDAYEMIVAGQTRNVA